MPKVRVLIDTFCIGAMRVPKGEVIVTNQRAIDYMVLAGSGKQVFDDAEIEKKVIEPEPEVAEDDGYARRDMNPTPAPKKKRVYRRRDKTATKE